MKIEDQSMPYEIAKDNEVMGGGLNRKDFQCLQHPVPLLGLPSEAELCKRGRYMAIILTCTTYAVCMNS